MDYVPINPATLFGHPIGGIASTITPSQPMPLATFHGVFYSDSNPDDLPLAMFLDRDDAVDWIRHQQTAFGCSKDDFVVREVKANG
jgi:hypothetical protein